MTQIRIRPAVLTLLLVATWSVNCHGQGVNQEGRGVTSTTTLAKVNVEAKTDEERALITGLIQNTYSNLDENQRRLVDGGLFFVLNYDEKMARFAAAFGPEDDPAYDAKHLDRKLYPTGTIKISFTLATLADARFINSPGLDPKVAATFKKLIFNDVVPHEIKHVEQYIAHPVFALSSPADCPEGVCDEKKLADTKIKMNYEFEATEYGRKHGPMTITPEEWAYATNWLKAHKSILTGTHFEGIEDAPYEVITQEMPEGMRFFYSAMYYPASWAQHCASGNPNDAEKAGIKMFLGLNEKTGHVLETAYPYLTPVVVRLKTCSAN